MPDLDVLNATPSRRLLGGAPAGRDAQALADWLRASPRQGLLFVARDDVRMTAMADALALFLPERETLTFPAWDCLPYDRLSPNAEVTARRLVTLSALAKGAAGGAVVLTTANAAIQRLPAAGMLAGARLACAVGQELDADELFVHLARNGFTRTETVMEPGEFAVRGGIIDLFPPGADAPLRLDLFGDVLDSIRPFDPLTQKSAGHIDGFELIAASEVLLDDDAIARFRTSYRDLFGAVTGGDELYEAISAGQRYPGMEHWLALFHDELATLFDYVPGMPVVLDHLVDEVRDERLAVIDDHYRTRLEVEPAGATVGAPAYRPAPPSSLYLGAADWERLLADRAVGDLSPFPAAPGDKQAIDLGARRARDFAPERKQRDSNLMDQVAAHVGERQAAGRRFVLACFSAGSRDRLARLLEEHGVPDTYLCDDWRTLNDQPPGTVGLVVLGLDHGFETDELVVLSEADIFGDQLIRRARRRRRAANFISDAATLAEGDIVVHVDHGIGRFEGLTNLEVGGAPHDCAKLIYAGGDRLFVPVENIEVISRYGAAEGEVQLDKLGGAAWQNRKAKLKKRLRDMAAALIETAAQRLLRPADAMRPPDGAYEEFAARFPFTETDDQAQAIDSCVADLAAGRPMDRLVCGDVGFGKTEVALRAALVAVLAGRQVAVVVPTTLLSRQHYQTFSERFAGFPVRVAQLSRLVPARTAGEVRAALADGGIDIVIGTHALLAASVKFKNLGLLVIDEEQRFGVAQKEKLKALKADVHVLTLTATPIPRTLQLALTGVRDLSVIATPPVDRLAVRTFVLPFDPVIVREAIMRERHRGGQTFYICPRIEDLNEVAGALRTIVPDIKFVIAHGKMPARALEEAMTAFYDGEYDLLLSTSIIESGLDIPRVNTLIVHRADMFGLAQLYQLRGRVGRAKTRAYAYFTVPQSRLLKGAAQKRLEVIQAMDTLGAGFSLASHDLDIRGAGNLLGDEQSGHIREVGVELYQTLLEEAVRSARDSESDGLAQELWSPQITVGAAVMIPEDYVADLGLRLQLYRRLAELESDEEIEAFGAELVDRFGPVPVETEYLLKVTRLKLLARRAGVDKIEAGPKGAVIGFRDNSFAAPEHLVRLIAERANHIRLRADHHLVLSKVWGGPEQRIVGISGFIGELAAMAEGAIH